MGEQVIENAEWEEIGVAHSAVVSGTAVQAVRFASDDLRAVRAAARRAGVPTSEYIRAATMASVAQAAGVRVRVATSA